MNILHRFLTALTLLAATTSHADDFWQNPFSKLGSYLPDSFQVHGFLSQGYIKTNTNNFFGHSSNMGSLDFREIGINGSWQPVKNLQLALQVVSRNAGATDDGKLRVDFGLLSYTAISQPEDVWGIRLGRVVNPYGFYNDTRDMPFTRPSILLPQSVYQDNNRQLALSSDGVQIFGEKHLDIGDFFFQINGGWPRTTDPDLKQQVADHLAGNMAGQLSFMARLMYEYDGGRVRLGITGGEANAGFQPKTRRNVAGAQPGNFSFQPLLLSAQYNAEAWSLTSEWALREVTRPGLGLIPTTTQTGEAWYVQGAYRFTPAIEAFARYDVFYWDMGDRSGKEIEAVSGGSIPAYWWFAKDITTGIRWDITPSIMLRAEYHYINGTAWLSQLENYPLTNANQHWQMFAASISFRF
jgi:hypothetical protein